MASNNLVLFGKHPAWSDHMFISDDASVSNFLKRIFYDHSVIPALQGGEGDNRISETWSFLVFVEDKAFFIVNAVSRDSVGRRLFPLIVAYPLPDELKLEAALDALRELKVELLSLLAEMLEAPGEDLDEWQKSVTQRTESFRSKVDWSKVDSDELDCKLERDKVLGFISRLVEDYDSFDLKSCPFKEACCLVKLGLRQFRDVPPAMLIFDQEERGTGLFFAAEAGTSFNLRRHLHNNLASLVVSADSVPPQVSRLLKSAGTDDEDFVSADKIPSLKLGTGNGPINHRFLFGAIASAAIISIVFGLFYSCSGDASPIEEKSTQQLSPREQWILNSTAYVEWIQPLVGFVDNQSAPRDFEPFATVLQSDLNPFAVVEAEAVSMKLAKNPPSESLDSGKASELAAVYSNIELLKASLVTYYEKQFSDELLKELKRQNFPLPPFVAVDFSEQPLLPDFGPKLVDQLKTYLADRDVLSKLASETKALGDSIIKPLHPVCPEHAKYIQRYVQDLLTESESFDQFQSKYASLIELFGYPEFIRVNSIDFSKLEKNAEWNGILEKERSLDSMHELVKLLEAKYEDSAKYNPEEPSSPKAIIDVISNQKIPSVEDEIPTSGIDFSQLDSFVTPGFQKLQDARLVDAAKNHETALRAKILEGSALENPIKLSEFKEQIQQLVTAFKRLDSDSMAETSEFGSYYIGSEQRQQYLSDYMVDEYLAADIAAGDIESVTKISQEINRSVDGYLKELEQLFANLETSYFLNQNDETNVDLAKQIAENPLYVEGVFGARLNIIQAAASGEVPFFEKAKDLNWYLETLLSKGKPSETHLTLVTKAFDVLEPTEQTAELSSKLLEAFDRHSSELKVVGPKSLLDFYKNLDTYLPQSLHKPQDKALSEIALYWDRYSNNSTETKPSKEELEKLRDSAIMPTIQKFYAELLANYDEISSQKSDTFLDKIEEVSGVESVLVNDDSSQIKVIFEGKVDSLIFLPVETQSGTIFVQQSPLTLQQYIGLSKICGFDTEYYLTLQDSFWPRSFEVGIELGFSVLEKWQFRNRDVFLPIGTFSKRKLPAHLNEPREVLRMAEFLGFRLIRPEECADFIRLEDRSSFNRLEITDADKENLERVNTIQSSVYAEWIMDSIEQGTWTGGVDFERATPGEDQFFDVIGGSAELAYDGVNFYAFGGSWLYEPSVPEKPFKVKDPKRMYIDLGVRFTVDAPTQSYSDLVQKLAFQLVTENK